MKANTKGRSLHSPITGIGHQESGSPLLEPYNALAATMRDTLAQIFKVPELTVLQPAASSGGTKDGNGTLEVGDREKKQTAKGRSAETEVKTPR